MFNIIEKNQMLVKGIMIAIGATFVLWGVGGYIGMSGDDGYVAKVGSNKIYKQDIDQAIQQNPQNTDKMQILFGLINRQLLLNNFEDYHMKATNDQLQQEIASIPIFQESGTFNLGKYQTFLRQKYLTADQFQNNISQQLLLNQTLDFFKNTSFNSSLFDEQFAKLLSRQRNISTYTINPQEFYTKINLSDKQIDNYYKQNIAKFTIPDKVKVQFIQLSANQLANTINPTDAEINKYINDHKKQLSSVQVNASHILFTIPKDADAKTKADIRARGEKILVKIKSNPSQFEKLAKEFSQDPGSADKGGSLGLFGKGVMAKPFEDVAFSMKPGQISDLVETQFGYHIIKLNTIKVNDSKQTRDTAITVIRKQKAILQLSSQLEQLNDITYNQPKTLDPAAKKFGLTIQTSDWIDKGALQGDFADPKIQQVIFSNDLIKNHNNSEVIDLGNGLNAVYRVVEFQPAKVQPLALVKNQIETQLKQQQGSSLAAAAGQKNIELLSKGKLNLHFTNSIDVTLLGQNIDPSAVKQIFSTPLNIIPAYTGAVDSKGSFVIYKINSETINAKFDAQNKKIVEQLNINNQMLDLGAYINYLRSKYSVTYKTEQLNNKNNYN